MELLGGLAVVAGGNTEMAQQSIVGRVATTVARDNDGIMRVTYHSTVVVAVYPNGKIVLNHGGYMTHTTKTRMNQASNQYALGFQVFQRDFAWFVDCDGHTMKWPDSREFTIRNGS